MRMEWKSLGIEKKFSFPLVCLFGGLEKWRDRKLFYLVENKSGRMELKSNFYEFTLMLQLHSI